MTYPYWISPIFSRYRQTGALGFLNEGAQFAIQCKIWFYPNPSSQTPSMIASFINILWIANNIDIVNIHRYYIKSWQGSFDEDTWAIITVGVTLLHKVLTQSVVPHSSRLLKAIQRPFQFYTIHVTIRALIRYRNPIENFHVNIRIKWPIQICGHYIHQLHI